MVLNENVNLILSAIDDDEIDNIISDIVSNKNTVSVKAVATDNVEIDSTKFLRNTGDVPITATTTTPVFISNKDIVLNLNIVDADIDAIDNAKLPLGCENLIGDLNGTQNVYYQLKQNYCSNIPCINSIMPIDGEILSLPLSSPVYRVEEAEIDNLVYRVEQSDDTDNAKSPLIEDLDGIKDKYYQVEGKYGSSYDRSDDINIPPLPPESSAYTMNIPCICIPNDGEILLLPLLSPVYQVDINAKLQLKCEDSIGDLDSIQDEYYQVKRKHSSIYDRSDNNNPPPLPPEHPSHPSIMLHEGINNSIGEYKTICNKVNKEFWCNNSNRESTVNSNGEPTVGAHDCYINYDADLDATQQEVGKYSIRKLDAPRTFSTFNVKQSDEVKTLIEEVNEEYLFNVHTKTRDIALRRG